MSENKQTQPYSIHCENNSLNVTGVTKVVEITDREAQLKLASITLVIKGDGINITSLNNEKGAVSLQYSHLSSVSFRSGASLRGLFR